MSSNKSSHEADANYELRVRQSLPAHIWQMLKLGVYPTLDGSYERKTKEIQIDLWCQ